MKYLARTEWGSSDLTQCGFDNIKDAIYWLGDCAHYTGTIFRNSTSARIYQIERGKINFDRRMKKERF